MRMYQIPVIFHFILAISSIRIASLLRIMTPMGNGSHPLELDVELTRGFI